MIEWQKAVMREEDTYEFQTARLRKLLAERAPGKEISFDPTHTIIRFRISDPASKTELLTPKGEWFPDELADKSDDIVWGMLRRLAKGRL
jgi:hypothetical protein